jgi:uncharacterized membrane protein YoaK (UPF0700 family)
MIYTDRSARKLAYALAALAGYVDAIGFLMLGGFFVSFMSGNSTRLAVGLIDKADDWHRAGFLILCFLVGVIAGSLVGRVFKRRHRAVLLFVTGLLAIGAFLSGRADVLAASAFIAAAMGAENATFERDGEVQIGLTYMTGALVKAGQRIAAALMGDHRTAWVPHALLWGSLSAGAIIGATAYHFAGTGALWPAVGFSALSTIAAGRFDRI